jgi:hypothetical protein
MVRCSGGKLWSTAGPKPSSEGAGGFVHGKWSGDPGIDARLAELGLSIRCLPDEAAVDILAIQRPNFYLGSPGALKCRGSNRWRNRP